MAGRDERVPQLIVGRPTHVKVLAWKWPQIEIQFELVAQSKHLPDQRNDNTSWYASKARGNQEA